MTYKIWLINHYATEMYRDKSGRHYWFSKKLEENGFDVTVFCASTFHNNLEGIDTKGKKFIVKMDGNTPFIFVKTRPSVGNGIDRVLNMLIFYKNLFPSAKGCSKINGKPDVIVASSVHPLTMVAGVKIAKIMNIPCICEVRDLWPEAIFCFGKVKEKSIFGMLLIAGEHWIYKNADALIFTKEGDTDYIKDKKWDLQNGGDIDLQKAYYINNGVNLSAYEKQIKDNVLDDEDFESDSFNVTYAGAIRPVNNVGNILDAAKLLSSYGKIKFLIYGNGNQFGELSERIKNENITNVKLKGFIDRSYIPYVLSRSSVNVLNYSQEKFNWTRGNSSNKLFEYMASGKPVISTVKMGYSIIDKYQCGIELEYSAPKELADAVLKVYQMTPEEYLTMGMNAKKGATDFDFDVLTNKLLSVIKHVLNI